MGVGAAAQGPALRAALHHAARSVAELSRGGLESSTVSGRVSDVAEALNVTLPVASRQVAALERAGYVRRATDPDDGRAHQVTATEAGQAVLESSHRRMVDAFSTALSDWSESDVESLSTALDRLREDVGRSRA